MGDAGCMQGRGDGMGLGVGRGREKGETGVAAETGWGMTKKKRKILGGCRPLESPMGVQEIFIVYSVWGGVMYREKFLFTMQ